MRTRPGTIALCLAALLADACASDGCTPGEQRPCARTLDGGATQRGFEACTSRAEWSSCVAVGACTGGAMAPTLYARCDDDAQCGPAGCGTCGHYAGVQNPKGERLCLAYCQADADCAPTSPATNVSPRCVLGQCALLCRGGSTCPRDARCMAWATPEAGAGFTGWDGICQ